MASSTIVRPPRTRPDTSVVALLEDHVALGHAEHQSWLPGHNTCAQVQIEAGALVQNGRRCAFGPALEKKSSSTPPTALAAASGSSTRLSLVSVELLNKLTYGKAVTLRMELSLTLFHDPSSFSVGKMAVAAPPSRRSCDGLVMSTSSRSTILLGGSPRKPCLGSACSVLFCSGSAWGCLVAGCSAR